MGREQLRKNLQLAVFLQRLSRRTSFPSKSALDENGKIPPEHRTSAEAGRRAHDQARAHVRLSRSRFAKTWRTHFESRNGKSDIVRQAHRLPSESPTSKQSAALQTFPKASAEFFFLCFALFL